ncbi:MAG: hypothetical protein PHE70_10510 [Tepidanaerobacteraceae bacterium]|nr:hypothetical protein [Tepidanaerobacteraceae bacterium]
MHDKKNDILINFEGLTVTSVGPSSGIFIGKNRAIGWSAHSKSNVGLGSASGEVSHNINIVYDNDLIDSPIDDRDLIVDNDVCLTPQVNESTDINFDDVNVNSLTDNAIISVGKNKQSGWDAHGKANTGIGPYFGNSFTSGNVSVIADDDVVDSPINDQDFKPNISQR